MMKPKDEEKKPTYAELEKENRSLRVEVDYWSKDRINRQAKNSVFIFLFSQMEYALQIYKELHPEDSDVTPEDIRIITVRNVMGIHKYNDLGLLVKGTLIVLVEAQSEWSPNVIFRLPGYYFDEMDHLQDTENLDIHSPTKIDIPDVEAYVIYSGDKKLGFDTISLRKEFFDDKEGKPDFTAKIINRPYKGGIIEEYLGYCRVWDAQKVLYPDDPAKRVSETIRICLEKGYLVKFLTENRAEVEQIMLTAYEPRKVQEAQERSMKILGAIEVCRNLGIDDDTICQQISKSFGITTKYAHNYILTFEENEADKKAGLVNA